MREIEQNETSDIADEIKAMQDCFYALLPLGPNGRQRVLTWTVSKLNATQPPLTATQQPQQAGFGNTPAAHTEEQPE